MKPEGPVARRADYLVAPIPLEVAREAVRQSHYSKSAGNTAVYAHGLLRRTSPEGGDVVGAALWQPPPAGAAKWVSRWVEENAERQTACPPSRVLSLSRLVVAEGEPQNAAGMLLGASVKLIARDRKYCALVTYADSWQGHAGTVYRATGWTFAGETEPLEVWTDPRTGQVVSVVSGLEGRSERGFRRTTKRSRRDMIEAGFESQGKHAKLRFVKVLGG